MMSIKQQESKRIITRMDTGETITGQSAIHLGQIINPGTNETISIVIPLTASGQLSGLSIPSRLITNERGGCKIFIQDGKKAGVERELKLEPVMIDGSSSMTSIEGLTTEATSSTFRAKQEIIASTAASSSNPQRHQQQQQQRADKTKGCPFPTCSRYGRAFSRAHDLKRHIARHETRKERLVETTREDIRTCPQCGESFLNETILQRHALTHCKPENGIVGFRSLSFPLLLTTQASPTATTTTVSLATTETPIRNSHPCHLCKKKYFREKQLVEHLLTHQKEKTETSSHVCPLCSCEFEDDEKLQDHMREHTACILQTQEALNKALDKSTQVMRDEVDRIIGGDNEEEDDDDEFMLEEMLLLNKNPRLMRDESSTSGNVSTIAQTVIAPSATSTSVVKSSSSSSSPNNINNNKIRCDYCSKTFKTKWTLSSHVAAHEGRFQFCCTRCGKKFVRKSHFEGHVRSHEAARPYVCEQCGKTFKELKHRREHTKRKHPGNQIAIQNLLDSISACVSEESSAEPTKFTLVMPMNFGA